MQTYPFFKSLRGKITLQMLAVSLVPVLIVGLVAYGGLSQATQSTTTNLENTRAQLVKDVVGANLENEAKAIALQIDQYMLERMSDTIVWVTEPVVIDTARKGYATAEDMGLPKMSIDEIEAKMADTRLLPVDTTANEYLLLERTLSPNFSEIFFTDAHGYAVAHTNMTSDFVQSDEAWWQTSFKNGIYVSAIEYDDSSKVWSIALAPRIYDPKNNELLGVMKAVLDVNLIQQVADQSAARIPGSSIMVVTTDGLLVAETASGHDPKRIMNEDVNVRKVGEAQVFDTNHASGFLLDDKLVTAFADSQGAEFYKSVPGFTGFGWKVIVQLPKDKAYAPLASLETTVSDLNANRQRLVLLVIVVLAVTLVGSLALALWLASSITRPISHLSEIAKKISMGDTSMHVDVTSKDEIGELAATFNRMLSAMRLLLDDDKKE
jgi:methyl-accepting chemotaxis protein PixJ